MTDQAPGDPRLDGKRALVTGAGQGIGRGIATALAGVGCHVLVNDLDATRAGDVVESILGAGGRAESLPFDVTDHVAVHQAITHAGGVDVLVNNAGNAGAQGLGSISRFTETSPEDWRAYVDVNLYGVMNCVHATLPGMTGSGWGRVITIVSDAGRTGGSHLAAYSAAKAGAAGFCRAIAREVAQHGVTVNTISLGTMRTPLSEALWRDRSQQAMQDQLMAGYLVRRPGEPDDVAWLTIALASPRASWITGQTIPVNGGFSFAL